MGNTGRSVTVLAKGPPAGDFVSGAISPLFIRNLNEVVALDTELELTGSPGKVVDGTVTEI